MTNTYNSRKGHYGCKECQRRRRSMPDWKKKLRSKQTIKQKRIKFEEELYQYKKKHHKKPNSLNKGVFTQCWFRGNYEFEKRILRESRKSYRNWTWLKGKPNEKGWIVTRVYLWTSLPGQSRYMLQRKGSY